MVVLRKSAFFRVAVAPLTIMAVLSGCMKWSTVKVPVAQALAEEEPKKIRVTRSNGYVLVLESPAIEGDSLVGLTGRSKQRVAIPVEDVKRIEARKPDGVRTTLLVVGAGLTLAAIIGAASASDPEPAPRPVGGGTGELVSCPLVYSWDGAEWRLDSGTFGGAVVRSLARTDVDNLDFARAENGLLRLRLAAELPETEYVDAISVLAVDHEPGVTVVPDGLGVLHSVGTAAPPLEAVDDRGRDALARVLEADGWSWESSPSGRDTAVAADLRDGLLLTFPREPGARTARLIVDANNTPWAAFLMQQYHRLHGREIDAWHEALNADPARARRLGRKLAAEAFLSVSLETADGWQPQGLIWEAGPEIVKRQVLALDLSDVSGDRVRVRLESIPSFWLVDRVRIDYAPPRPFTVYELEPEGAVDRAGRDVRRLLSGIDGKEYVMERGDFADLTFRVPPVQQGLGRSYVLRSTGWYRIHTPGVGEPDLWALERIESEPGAVARLSVARMNAALAAMARADR
ncbi:MAG: hypothetical protein ACE5JR_04840 [Gemmatimonadota bacterium]